MNTLMWHLHQWARHLGRTGLAGLLLLIVATLIQFAHTMPLQAETVTLQARLVSMQANAKRVMPSAVNVPASGFIDRLPETTAASAVIGQLEQIARAHGLRLLRGQYAQTPVSGTSLLRWQLSLPIKAEYPKIISFIAASLQALPTLALDELKLKRETIESSTLDADLRFNLYLRESAP